MAVKIMAADDSATMRRVLEMTFAGESVEMLTVESGEAVLERAPRWVPDLVIADAAMEGMDGYDVSRALKTNPATQGTAVLILASQHNPFDVTRGRDCGVDDHILKPYDTQLLIDKTREVLSKPRAKAAAGAGPTPAPPRAPSAGRPRPSGGPTGRSTVMGPGASSEMNRPHLELADEEPAPRPSRPS
ncbi:MAG: PleD family two-component system response regulator, partial [Sandaracinaceae bacterium]